MIRLLEIEANESEMESAVAYQALIERFINGSSTDAIEELRRDTKFPSLSNFYLAIAYRDGHCVQVDLDQSKDLFKASAELGIREAAYYLGRIYFDEKDYRSAVLYFDIAVNAKLDGAAYWLYKSLLNIDPEDGPRIMALMIIAADEGNALAMLELGSALIRGRYDRRNVALGLRYIARGVTRTYHIVKSGRRLEDTIP